MGLFKEKEVEASVYLPVDTKSTKITVYGSASFNVYIHVIRMGFGEIQLDDLPMPEFRANISGTNASSVTRGSVIKLISTGEAYQVENEPRQSNLFKNTYKVDLKKYKGDTSILH